MDLSIIILNYKTPQLTIDCITSIYEETQNSSFEIIVVDNNSQDNSYKLITGKHPDIIWIQQNENTGFARGNNEGIKKAKGEFILLLNSDTLILDKAIEKCLSFFESQQNTNVGVVGCKLLNEDHILQPSSHLQSGWPNLKHTLLQNIVIHKFVKIFYPGYFNTIKNNRKFSERYNTTHETAAVSGAFMLLKRKILKTVGLFDPDFFLYFEELEWSYRMAKKGFKIIYYHNAHIIHYGSKSSSKSKSKLQLYLSQGLFILKLYSRLGYFVYLIINYFNIITSYIFLIFIKPSNQDAFYKFVRNFQPCNLMHWKIMFQYSRKYNSNSMPLRWI